MDINKIVSESTQETIKNWYTKEVIMDFIKKWWWVPVLLIAVWYGYKYYKKSGPNVIPK